MADDTNSKPASPLAAGVAIAKDMFALLRDFALFTVGGLLLLFPATFNTIMTNAGFEEGSFAGLKWKAGLDQTTTQLLLAQNEVSRLQRENEGLNEQLQEVLMNASAESSAETSSIQLAEVERLQQENRSTRERVRVLQESVDSTLISNQPLAEQARGAASTQAPPSTAFCYQEDSRQPGLQQYSVHCHETDDGCESARGPNPRTRQSGCESVSLSRAQWTPRHPGWMGSWFEFRSNPFGAPFPQLPQ